MPKNVIPQLLPNLLFLPPLYLPPYTGSLVGAADTPIREGAESILNTTGQSTDLQPDSYHDNNQSWTHLFLKPFLV